MIRVGIVGANGYTGFELMRLLKCHGAAKITYIGSRSNGGTPVRSLYPALSLSYGDIAFDELDLDACAKACDVVFTALPHGAAAETVSKLYEKGVKIIDLSADFRYDDMELYEKTYKANHPAKELNKRAVYGLCEINRDKIKDATLIGNPGCYTTCSILPLYPLLKEKVVKSNGIIIDAKSGVSGAGRKADADYGFCEIDGNFSAYAVTTHRHTSEIEEKLSFDNTRMKLSFTPHLLPVKRGILTTIYTELSDGITAADIQNIYDRYYSNEKFVKVSHDGTLPQLKWITHSNVCSIGYKIDTRLNRLIIVSCLDNLVKGAAGQAIQNMNIMFGLDESEGLNVVASHL